VITAGLTFLAILALFLFGGEALNNFAFALLVGQIVGTYSSIAIAAPLVLIYRNFRVQPEVAALGAAKRPKPSRAVKS
jgi:preprotein translocase subunit SecF